MNENKKEQIKQLIKRLHGGEKPEDLKDEFRDVLADIDAAEISKIEDELVKEGMPREEIRRLCDVHLAIFKESLEKEKIRVEPGHPVHTFMEEHKLILSFLEKLKSSVSKIKKASDFNSVKDEIEKVKHIAEHLVEADLHHRREEEALFPGIEKHGIKEPPAVMLLEHEELKPNKKKLYELVLDYEKMDFRDFVEKLEALTTAISDMLPSHIYKEDNILYPMSLNVIEKEEWKKIKELCDNIGYCCFTPEYARKSEK